MSTIFSLLLVFSLQAQASLDSHWVGWTNTFVPGGGELLLGNFGEAAIQAGIETSTFGVGFAMSKLSPMTIDGVPEDYPALISGFGITKTQQKNCVKYNASHVCTQYTTKTVSTENQTFDYTPYDATKPLTAALLQEVGLKYHMMNVFDSYRKTIKENGEDEGQGVDYTPTEDLLKSPFQAKYITDPYVWIPLLLVATFTAIDYSSQIGSLPATQPLTDTSNAYLAFNQTTLYSFGSGAPEEMFYRGFLQNEFYRMVRSPLFSIPMSSLAFSFSHEASGRPTAAVSGLYLGFLAQHYNGQLGPGITLHFWSVFLLGLETYLLSHASQGRAPAAVSTTIPF